jgi:hypothetical protein
MASFVLIRMSLNLVSEMRRTETPRLLFEISAGPDAWALMCQTVAPTARESRW